MTKKEYCLSHPAVAYWSGCDGVEIHGIEYGIIDYIYCVSSAWYGGTDAKRYHKLKIYNGEYFMLNGYKIPLNECLRMGGINDVFYFNWCNGSCYRRT